MSAGPDADTEADASPGADAGAIAVVDVDVVVVVDVDELVDPTAAGIARAAASAIADPRSSEAASLREHATSAMHATLALIDTNVLTEGAG